MNQLDAARVSGAIVLFTLAVAVGLLGLTLVIVLGRGPAVDGRRAAGHFFFSLGLMVALVGLTVCVADLTAWASHPSAPLSAARPGGFFNPAQRAAAAISTVGVATAVVGWVLIEFRSPGRDKAGIGRSFTGTRLAVAAMVTVLAASGLGVALVQKRLPDMLAIDTLAAAVLVWLPTTAAHVRLLGRHLPATETED